MNNDRFTYRTTDIQTEDIGRQGFGIYQVIVIFDIYLHEVLYGKGKLIMEKPTFNEYMGCLDKYIQDHENDIKIISRSKLRTATTTNECGGHTKITYSVDDNNETITIYKVENVMENDKNT